MAEEAPPQEVGEGHEPQAAEMMPVEGSVLLHLPPGVRPIPIDAARPWQLEEEVAGPPVVVWPDYYPFQGPHPPPWEVVEPHPADSEVLAAPAEAHDQGHHQAAHERAGLVLQEGPGAAPLAEDPAAAAAPEVRDEHHDEAQKFIIRIHTYCNDDVSSDFYGAVPTEEILDETAALINQRHKPVPPIEARHLELCRWVHGAWGDPVEPTEEEGLYEDDEFWCFIAVRWHGQACCRVCEKWRAKKKDAEQHGLCGKCFDTRLGHRDAEYELF